MNHKRKKAYQWGRLAEWLAMLVLILKGYSIVAWRHRNHGGEVDIIARRGKVLSFIEVKARADKDAAIMSITQDKQQRVLRAAEQFIATHQNYTRHYLRFDVMMVTSWRKITHLTDVWRA